MALTFCSPPVPSSSASLLGSTKTLIPARTILPLTKPPTSLPLLGTFPIPPLPKKNNIKRVVHPSASSTDGPAAKKRKVVSRAGTPSSRPSPTAARPRPPPPKYVSDDEPEIDYRSFGTRVRSSTPKEGTIPFGLHEEDTKKRCRQNGTRLYEVHVGIREDGRVHDLTTSEDVVKPIMHRYKKYFHNPENPNDSSFDPHSTDYPVVELEYPNFEATEKYILLSPIDKDHYHPILELMEAMYTMVSCYLLPHQQVIFGRLPCKYSAYNAKVSPEPWDKNNTAPAVDPTLTDTEYSGWVFPSGSDASCSGRPDVLRSLEKAYNTGNGPLFIQTVQLFNTILRQARGKMIENVRYGWVGVPPQVSKVVVEECYQRSVGPSVKNLKNYPPFSDLVYGELNTPFVSDILFRTEITSNSTFLDLGCGVGNCLIQAALQTGCEANGIELHGPPAALGKAQVEHYKKRLRLWGVSSGDVTLLQGNFCESAEVRDWIKRANLVLVNNWAFSSELNEKLSLLFLDLPEGAQIASLKPFRRSDFRLTERTASSPEAIFSVQEITFRKGTVSWMAEGGVYYLHTVNREPLRLFIERETLEQTSTASARKRRTGSAKDADGWN